LSKVSLFVQKLKKKKRPYLYDVEKTNLSIQLNELLRELSVFKSDDPLVNLSEKQCVKIGSGNYPLSKELEKIISEAKKTEKEKGIFPLCKSRGVIRLCHQKKEVETPLFIIPLSVQLNRINQTVAFTEISEEALINPFLRRQVENEFSDLKLPEKVDDSAGLVSLLYELGFEFIDMDVEYIGNFHHHRLTLLGELEQLIKRNSWSSPLIELFGEEVEKRPFNLPLPNATLFPFDEQQAAVFEQLKGGNCVVQGPPGTGKSQVICNVIGKLLVAQTSTLVLSDKRVALEVIQQKLDAIGLGQLSVITTTNYSSHALVKNLKKNWITIETEQIKNQQFESLFQQEITSLQKELSVYNQAEAIGGISVREFLEQNKSWSDEQTKRSSTTPSIKTWLEHKEKLQKLPAVLLFQLRYISNIQQAFSTVLNFEIALDQWLNTAQLVQNNFGVQTIGDFKKLLEKARICHRFSTSYFRQFEHVIVKDHKLFLSTLKKYLETVATLEKTAFQQNHWIKIPTPTELSYLEKEQQQKGFLHAYRWKKELKKWLRTPGINFSEAINSLKKRQVIEDKLMKLTQVFSDLGIKNLSIDLEIISSLIEQQDYSEWNVFRSFSQDECKTLNANYTTINNLMNDFRSKFNFTDEVRCIPYLQELVDQFNFIKPFSVQLSELPKDLLECCQNNQDLAQLERQIYQTAWSNFKTRFPAFSVNKAKDFLARIESLNETFDSEINQLVQVIRLQQQQTFNSFHALLQTPAYKLSPEEKTRKQQLKAGKAILVKEFAKKRRNKSIRELLSSEAAAWIQLLKPIWLTNPSQLASNIPLEKNYFDLTIIDEASQLLLSHSIGCLYRSKRVLIAGDSQQMAPSNYFNPSDENSITLLHKASFYFKNIRLQYHFRSEHPSLIAYSNDYFYNNELIAFPSYKQAIQPLKFHHIESGRYMNRKNEIEAKFVAKHIAALLSDKKEKIGIVAFSAAQLSCIFDQLTSKEQEDLLTRIDQDTLFFKSLEQIQGDECDRLIVSFGYAKNETAQFDMRFGPVNEKNGAKRLNVLFSRARRNIDFFASVTSKDFSITDNNSVRLLWRWFLFVENEQREAAEIKFPFQLALSQQGKTLSSANWANLSSNASDILTITRTLKNRGWQLGIS